MNNFWRFLDLPLINCEIELDLPLPKEYIISEFFFTLTIPATPDANPYVQEVPATKTTVAAFHANNAKFYVPVITFSINIKFLENVLRKDFKK